MPTFTALAAKPLIVTPVTLTVPTFTLAVATRLPSRVLAVIVAVPALLAVIVPFALTVAI